MIPSPWTAFVLTLGAFRMLRLISWDDLPPVARLRARATGEYRYRNATESDGPIFRYKRPTLAHFIACPFCLGFWISVATYAGWVFEPRWTLYAAAPFALSTILGLAARWLDP